MTHKDKLSKEDEQKIAKLQLLEQNLQSFLMQKQNFSGQLMEVENALEELDKSKDDNAYKIIGSIMVSTTKSELKKDLNSKKEIIELRIKNIEKQEKKIKDQISDIQKEVMEKFKNE